jgi:Short C-terminal domain
MTESTGAQSLGDFSPGGIQLGANPGGAPPATDAVIKLEQAKAMRDKGLISDAEYASLKARIVSSL